MNISRTHFLMMSVVSIFTGMIAPTIGNGTQSMPYAMTNMQYVAYGILASLVLLFILSILRWHRLSQLVVAFLIVVIVSLGMMTIMGIVKSFSGELLRYFAWGWIFLLIGLVFLIAVFMKEESSESWYQEEPELRYYEKIISISGIIIFTILSAFVVFVAEKNASKSIHASNIEKIFAKNITKTESGLSLSAPFEKISDFSYDRKKDILSFIGTASGATVAYPSEKTISRPDDLLLVRQFGERTFFVQKTGEVIENGEWIGQTSVEKIQDGFLTFVNADKYIELVTDKGSRIFATGGENPDIFTYIEKTGDLYWRSHFKDGHALYKNSQPVTEIYPAILRYTVASDDSITMIAEDESFNKMVVKNNTVVHTMYPDYVQGTLKMNASDVLYVVKNSDESFSVVLNGVILDRKLDEIREIFIEQNASGFSYFGRPQGGAKYCFFTRYRGNLCEIDGYMNPVMEADNAGVIFAVLRGNKWSIYRNVNELVKNPGYASRPDISHDYFLFDPTNPRRYIFIEKLSDGYHINKMGTMLSESWLDIDPESLQFGDNNLMYILVQDSEGWKILEF